MRCFLILRNGYKLQGRVLHESASELIIDEIKLGKTTIDKTSIAVRSDRECDDER